MKRIRRVLTVSACAILFPAIAFGDGDETSWQGDVASERYTAAGSEATDQALSDAEIYDIIQQSGAVSEGMEVRYLGGDQIAAETEYCCGETQEQYEAVTQVEEIDEYIDVVTQRDIIQPIETTRIQPVIQEILQPQTENIYEDMVYETQQMPVRVERDPVPEMTTKYHQQLTVNEQEEITETYYDVVTRREIIQPVERTTIVPVQRRIVRPRVETVTAEPRYITVTNEPLVNKAIVPETVVNVMDQQSYIDQESYSEIMVPYVETRNVYQPKTITSVQRVERQILNPVSESVTEETVYETVRLDPIVKTEAAPTPYETIIPQIRERTVLEVEDVYIDRLTRNVIQPVIETTIQPVVNQVISGRIETETRPVIYNSTTLPAETRRVVVPETRVNYIPQVENVYQEAYSETYFDAVTHRDVYQPVVRTVIQPIENRRIRETTETITNPTRYETVRASLVVLTLDAPCGC